MTRYELTITSDTPPRLALVEEPTPCDSHECGDDAVEHVDIARISGNEDAATALPLCSYHANETRTYWDRMAREERI